jgi:hypothetical protein
MGGAPRVLSDAQEPANDRQVARPGLLLLGRARLYSVHEATPGILVREALRVRDTLMRLRLADHLKKQLAG